MSDQLVQDLHKMSSDARLLRCQVDVSFPSGFKHDSQPQCPWFRDFGGMPQIIEVIDTGCEIYHFQSIAEAEKFAEETRRRVIVGDFAGERLPAGSSVRIQLRATIEVARDVIVTTQEQRTG